MSVERFVISARLMIHLGEALISDELVALMELIKNSYDADANFARVSIDSAFQNGKGQIIVKDDGNGMDYDVITKGFLVLATDYKIQYQKYSPRYNRLALGNKGIGRLSLQRLGSMCSVTTKMEGKNAFTFSINWGDFYDTDKDIYDIAIDVLEKPELNEKFAKGHGTIIEILGIKNPSLWEADVTYQRFKSEILSIINPFADEKSKFSVYLNINGKTLSSDQYDVALIRDYSDVSAEFHYFSSEKRITIEISRQNEYIIRKLKSMEKRYGERFEIEHDDERIIELFKHKSISLFINQIDIDFPYVDTKKNPIDEKFLPGDFSGTIYAFEKGRGRYTKEQSEFLDTINGVKLFRNGFRILPYGDPQNDWLNFTKYSQTVKANIYKNHTTSGYVYIDGEENLSKIKEMTNRQGIINDEYGNTFLSLCGAVISRILMNEDVLFSSAFNIDSSLAERMVKGESYTSCKGLITFTKKEDYVNGAVADATLLKKDFAELGLSDTAKVQTIGETLNRLEERVINIRSQLDGEAKAIKEQQSSIDEFKVTIGSALIAEFMSHEIMRTVNTSLKTIERIRELTQSKAIDTTKIVMLLDAIIVHLNYLSKYAGILDFNSYVKKRRKESVNIRSYLLELLESIPFLSQDGGDIRYSISGDNVDLAIIKTNFTIAIENLLINSKYWLDRHRVKDKKITFELDSKNRIIAVFDNGYGIYKEVEDRVFDAFVSAKPEGEGRGIGLFIAQRLLNEMGMVITLSEERNKNGLLYKFLINY